MKKLILTVHFKLDDSETITVPNAFGGGSRYALSTALQ